jgi:oligopeptidase B
MDPPIERDDDLFWLRDDDRKDPAIIAHLEAENAHTEAHLAHVQPLAKRVYDEIIGSIQETDDDVPFRWGDKGHTYMVRTVKGKAYPIVVRKIDEDKDWETVLDVNAVAAPLKYCSVGSFRPDPSHELLAYSIDPSGYETYEVRFKDLDTGADLPDVIKGTAGSVSWGHCDASTKYREVYYSTQDDAHRPDKVWRHVIGTDQSKDVCVLHEPDELFNVGFGKTSSGPIHADRIGEHGDQRGALRRHRRRSWRRTSH